MTVILWIIAVLALLYLAFTFFLFYISFWRFEMGPKFSKFLNGPSKPDAAPDFSAPGYVQRVRESQKWLDTLPAESLQIQSFDGLKLRARLYKNPEAKAVMVACHGFHSSGVKDFGPAAAYYYGLGFSLLFIDQRACGDSEGRCATYGVLESRDARAWCQLMADRYPGMPILLAGVSLGSATVMMASDNLPAPVKAIIADCGFNSPYDQLAVVASRSVNFPAGIKFLLVGVDMWCRLLAHIRLKQWSSAQALAKTTRPVLFIHGESDTLVPYTCTEQNMAACASPHTLFSLPDAGHAVSFFCDPEGYKKAVGGFLNEYFF